MKRVTIRVPATTANLGPGFDAFGCALKNSPAPTIWPTYLTVLPWPL